MEKGRLERPFSFAWPDPPPGGGDEQRELHVKHRERPFREIIEQETVHPLCNERPSGVAPTQLRLPYRQRAPDAEQGLAGDENDGREVRDAEPEVAHPYPSRRRPDPDQGKTPHHEGHEQEMHDQDEVCKPAHDSIRTKDPAPASTSVLALQFYFSRCRLAE